jgi:hypothetical protein
VTLVTDAKKSGKRDIEEAHIGKQGEEMLTRLLRDRKDIIECLEKLTKIKIGESYRVGKGSELHLQKTDVVIITSDNKRIGISLKTFKSDGRPDDHLDRRWLDRPSEVAEPWAKVLGMPQDIVEILKQGILNIAKGISNQLVPDPQNQQKVKEFFMGAKILRTFLEEAFRNGEQELLILALMEYNSGVRLCLFNMDEVINFIEKDIRNTGITFGSRINFGKYIQLQRKAGDGKHVRIPECDPRHPGNQLQVKLLCRVLMEDVARQLNSCCFELGETFAKPSRKTLMNYAQEKRS